jgi:hypothetical protein
VRTIARVRSLLSVLLCGLVVAAGCGGDDDQPTTPSLPTTTQAAPAPSTAAPEPEEPEKGEEPRRERTPKSLAGCIRSAGGASEVLVKGRDSEDATFFADLVGGRVDVLGVTLEGESAEVSVFLFDSEADAAKAAPSAGGGGVTARAIGSAVVAAPRGARLASIETCLRATGYA